MLSFKKMFFCNNSIFIWLMIDGTLNVLQVHVYTRLLVEFYHGPTRRGGVRCGSAICQLSVLLV